MMEYDILSNSYPVEHLSVSTTQTIIEENDPDAITKEVCVEHTGVEVLKISKNLLEIIKKGSSKTNPATPHDVCDGVIVTGTSDYIGYFELKSQCSTTNFKKARKQILDSRTHLSTAFSKCNLSMAGYTEKGIIVTQPLSVEDRRKAIQRRQRDDERGVAMSEARMMLKIIAGNFTDSSGLQFLHRNANEVIPLAEIR